ncbi:MAG: SPOR domain-containing protein [Treponemataceae bacterium]|nr:SPOR domain-containing protein [Treponemataceae bacterium]
MENKKLYLAVIIVGIFLVLVIGVSLLVFLPKKPLTTAYASTEGSQLISAGNLKPGVEGTPSASAPTPAGGTSETVPPSSSKPEGIPPVNPSEWVKNPQTIHTLPSPPQTITQSRGDVIIIYGDNTVTGSRSVASPTTPQGSSLTIEVPGKNTPSPSVTADGALGEGKVEQKQSSGTGISTSTSPGGPTGGTRPTAAVSATPPTGANNNSTQGAKEITRATPRTYTDYWIQTGAFTSKTRAEDVRGALAQKGIKSFIDVKMVDNTTYYRVRVGPYTSKSEAEYWLKLIHSLDGFTESYISSVTVKR